MVLAIEMANVYHHPLQRPQGAAAMNSLIVRFAAGFHAKIVSEEVFPWNI